VHQHVLAGVAPAALSGKWDDFTAALDEHGGSLGRSFLWLDWVAGA